MKLKGFPFEPFGKGVITNGGGDAGMGGIPG